MKGGDRPPFLVLYKEMQRFILIFILFCMLFVPQVHAHSADSQPFLKVNGVYPETHPVQKETIVPKNFSIPEDVVKKPVLVNKEVLFTIDEEVFASVYEEDVLKTLTYQWDLGDGTTAEGTEVKHTYKSMGSKVITILVDFNDPQVEFAPQPIESVQLDVLPNTDYIIPEVVIRANNQELPDDFIEMRLQAPVKYEAIVKNKPSAEVISYTWDFGDGDTSTEQQIVHTYAGQPLLAAPVVKVTDKNGFTTYAFGLINNNNDAGGFTFPANTVGAIILGVQAVAVIVGVGIFIWAVLSQKKKKGKSK